ncbi:Putative membrane protein (fragment) [Xanthomonas citri pv. fuscans]
MLVTLFFSLPAALCVVLLSAALRRITNKPRTRALA